MEIVLAIGIFALVAAGLGLGLMLGRGPLKGSCGGMACLKDVACEGCPHRGKPAFALGEELKLADSMFAGDAEALPPATASAADATKLGTGGLAKRTPRIFISST